MFYQYRDQAPSSSSSSSPQPRLRPRPAFQRSGTSGTTVRISVEPPVCTDSTSSRPILIVFLPSLNEQSHTPSSGTSRDSLDPVLLTPDYTFAHAPIPRDEGSPRHRLEREEDDYNHTHTQSPGIVTADHLPPGFIPTSPSFVPLVLDPSSIFGFHPATL